MKRLHNLLARQLTRLSLHPDSRAGRQRTGSRCCCASRRRYADADQDRYLLERSQDISSREMQELYDALQHERDQLESRVARADRGARGERGALSQPHVAGLGLVLGAGPRTSASRRSPATPSSTPATRSRITSAARAGRSTGYEPPEGGWAAHRALLDAHQPFQDLVFTFRLADGSAAYRGGQRRAGVRARRRLRGLPRHRSRRHAGDAAPRSGSSGWRVSIR